jgi:hypothetical protein
MADRGETLLNVVYRGALPWQPPALTTRFALALAL